MNTSTLTLVEFLTTRLDEDEAAAVLCTEAYPGSWEVTDRGWVAYITSDEPWRRVTQLEQFDGGSAEWFGEYLEHIARHDPARVLAEVTAWRRLVNAYRAGFPDEDRYAMGWHDMQVQVLYRLASVYADHPDYDPAWK